MADNIIDITNKLPLEVRPRWKEQMALVRMHDKEIIRILNSLSEIRREWTDEKLPFPSVARGQTRDVEEAITLLLCASEKLMKAVPYTDEEIEEARRALDLEGVRDGYAFGVCPHCRKCDGWANTGNMHWLYCKEHGVRWSPGSNQNIEEQLRFWTQLGLDGFKEIQPAFPEAD